MTIFFPPSNTWLSYLACIAFQVTVAFLCLHERGPDLAKRGPTILGRWLRRRQNADRDGDGVVLPTSIKPPSSVAASWRLGALHERFFKGVPPGEESILREAGELLGAGRALTEEEFLSLARVSERSSSRPGGWFCNFPDCVLLAGIIGVVCTIGPALYYITTPIHSFLAEAITALTDLVRATPNALMCLLALGVSLAIVCDGFRASNDTVGARIALTGALGAVAAMYFSTMSATSYAQTQRLTEWVILLGYSAAVIAPIAVKFQFPLGGFLATASAYYAVYDAAQLRREDDSNSMILGSLLVDALFTVASLYGVQASKMQPFASGVMAMGVFLLHLALFFESALPEGMFWPEDPFFWFHVIAQLKVLAGLAAGWALGKKYGCEGLANNTLFFGFLYVATTTISLARRLPGKGGEAVGWVIASFFLWRVGLYLDGHRGFIASLWTLDAALVSAPNARRGRASSSDGGDSGDFVDENQHGGGDLLLGEGPTFELELEPPRASYAAPDRTSPSPVRFVKAGSGV